jgi:hypothetical protein
MENLSGKEYNLLSNLIDKFVFTIGLFFLCLLDLIDLYPARTSCSALMITWEGIFGCDLRTL